MRVSSEWTPVPLLGPHELTADEQQEFMLGIFNLGYGTASGEQLAWQDFALCAETDPDIFFPEKGGSTTPATSVCSQCMVQAGYLEYAILTTFATAFGAACPITIAAGSRVSAAG